MTGATIAVGGTYTDLQLGLEGDTSPCMKSSSGHLGQLQRERLRLVSHRARTIRRRRRPTSSTRRLWGRPGLVVAGVRLVVGHGHAGRGLLTRAADTCIGDGSGAVLEELAQRRVRVDRDRPGHDARRVDGHLRGAGNDAGRRADVVADRRCRRRRRSPRRRRRRSPRRQRPGQQSRPVTQPRRPFPRRRPPRRRPRPWSPRRPRPPVPRRPRRRPRRRARPSSPWRSARGRDGENSTRRSSRTGSTRECARRGRRELLRDGVRRRQRDFGRGRLDGGYGAAHGRGRGRRGEWQRMCDRASSPTTALRSRRTSSASRARRRLGMSDIIFGRVGLGRDLPRRRPRRRFEPSTAAPSPALSSTIRHQLGRRHNDGAVLSSSPRRQSTGRPAVVEPLRQRRGDVQLGPCGVERERAGTQHRACSSAVDGAQNRRQK